MFEAGTSRILEEQLMKYGIDVAALQEIRWREIDMVELNDYILINSGHKANILGTGFMIKKSLKHAFISYKAVNERICVIRLRGKFFNISLISIHAPTEDKSDEEKDLFFEELERTYNSVPRHDVKLVLGDMNAKIGREEVYRPIIGKFSKHEISNDNGHRIIDFAADKGMCVASTCFQHKEIHKETWISPDGLTRNQIDHVLIQSRHASDIEDVRSCRGADIGSDHFMVRVKYRQRVAIKQRKREEEKVAAYRNEELKDEGKRKLYEEKVKQLLERSEREGNSIEDKWNEIKSVVTTAADEVVGRRNKEVRNNWYDEECARAVQERNEARKKMLQRLTRTTMENYREKRRIAKSMCREKKRAAERKKLEDLREYFSGHNSRKFYRGLKEVRVGFKPQLNFCYDENGHLVGDRTEMLARWSRYFESRLNPQVDDENQAPMRYSRIVDGILDEEEPPDLEEVIDVIRALKNNKAAGEDGIPSELIKQAGEDLWKRIHSLIFDIWTEEKMPDSWSTSIICPIYKKGNKLDCHNYRGISLLNTTYKVFSALLMNRLDKWAEDVIGDCQSGFKKGRSTIDHISSMRIMLEKTYEYDVTLHHLFIDFQQAYDSLDRTELLQCMIGFGIPAKLVRLTAITLIKSKGRVKVQGAVSDPFSLNKGLRQGDPLSPILFNLALEKAIRAIKTSPNGTIYNRLSQHLAYADDVVLTGRTKTALSGAFEEFEAAAKKQGLQINEQKTKYMVSTRKKLAHEERIKYTPYEFERVKTFKYLGAVLTEKSDMSEEIKGRITAANRVFWALKNVFRFRELSREAKLIIYRTILRPTVTYASETWVLTKNDERRLNVWERKILRKIFGPVREGDRYRIRKNDELRELYQEQDLVGYIKRGRLRWLGHIVRMEETRVTKKLLDGHPGGARRKGRPRKRWLDDVEEDIRSLGIRRWRRVALVREEWTRVVEEAKVLRGP